MSHQTLGYTPGSGADVAIDRVASQDFQRVKLVHGAEGEIKDVTSATPVPMADAAAIALLQTIAGLNDTLAMLMSQLVAIQPGKHRDGSLRVVGTDGTGLMTASPWSVNYMNMNSNPTTGQPWYRQPETWQFSNAGSAQIYDRIQVTP